MAGRSPARFLAPLALVAFVVALFVIVTSTSGGGEGGAGTPASDTSQPAATATPAGDDAERPRKRRVYVVKPGDTPSGIAEKTGVTLEQLEEANPDLDPQLLAPGQRIRLPR
jgi:LysM repeat protein